MQRATWKALSPAVTCCPHWKPIPRARRRFYKLVRRILLSLILTNRCTRQHQKCCAPKLDDCLLLSVTTPATQLDTSGALAYWQLGFAAWMKNMCANLVGLAASSLAEFWSNFVPPRL